MIFPSIKPAEFQAVVSAWDAFEVGLRRRNRFTPTDRLFFDELAGACLRCVDELPVDQPLYRARNPPLHGSKSPTWLSVEEMTAPPPTLAVAGRLNPEGIPYLYAALEFDTAVAEIRPWRAANITVATLRTLRAVKVVDLRLNRVLREQSMSLHWLALNIGIPVHAHDPLAYVGTQFLAEHLKELGLAGLIYPSAMREGGTNVALFDGSAARVVGAFPYMVGSVTYRTLPEKRPEQDGT